MAQTELAEILNSMKEDNKNNAESLDKVLSDINKKLGEMSEDTESDEAIKAYLSELKRMLEDVHNYSVAKFTQIETAFTDMAENQENFAKTFEMNELFQYLNSSVNSFSGDIFAQKELIIDLEKRIMDFASDTTDKDEIISFVSQVKFDLERVFDKIETTENNFIAAANGNFENIKEILANISNDIQKQQEEIKEESKFQDEQNLKEIKTLEDNIQCLTEALNSKADDYKKLVEENIESVRTYIADMSNSLTETSLFSNNKITEKFSTLETLNRGFESSIIDVNINLQSVIKNLMTMDTTEQNDIIKRELENIYMATNAILSSLKISDQKNDDLAKIVTELVNQDNFEDFQKRINAVLTQTCEIAEQISTLTSKFDISVYFESLSKNIVDLSDRINSDITAIDSDRKQSFGILKKDMEEVLNAVKFNGENTPQRYIDLLAGLSIDIKESVAEFEKNIAENNTDNFDKLKTDIYSIENKIDEIKAELLNKECITNIAPDSDNIKTSFNEIDYDFNVLKKEIIQNSHANAATIIESFNEIYNKTANLLSEIEEKASSNIALIEANISDISERLGSLEIEFRNVSNSNVENFSSGVEEFAGKIESLQGNISLDIANGLGDLREIVLNLPCEFSTNHAEYLNQIIDNNEKKLAELKEFSLDLSNDYKNHINDVINSLKIYISELNSFKDEGDSNKFIENIYDIQNAISESYESYDVKLAALYERLNEHAQIIDKASIESDTKLQNSLTEINNIKLELANILDIVKNSDNCHDEKFAEVISNIDSGVSSIISNITDIKTSVNQGSSDAIEKSLLSLENKFDKLLSDFDRYKSSKPKVEKNDDDNISYANNDDLISDLSEKINALKQELGLVNTDLTEAFNSKSEEIIKSFEPVKSDIEGVFDSNFNKLLEDLKTQIEFSYMNVSSDFHNSVSENRESIDRLFDIYKETLDKISIVEECLADQMENSLELMRLAIENLNKNVDLNIDKTTSFIEEWKNEIGEIKDSLASVNENCTSSISSFAQNVKDTVGEKLAEYIDEIKTHISNNLSTDDTVQAIDGLKENLSSQITDLSESMDKFFENGSNVNALSGINPELLEAVNEKVDELINTDDKIIETLEALHKKIDILSFSEDMDDFDIRYELEDIKNLISNQRKLYDNSEKSENATVVDNCLGELQNKLDAIEDSINDCNSHISIEEIKETVLSAIASIFEQISFVEEAEEIKDFVEEEADEIKDFVGEKTDAINEQLIAVKEQLSKLASSEEGRDYSYTLQDVESDIAKLRMILSDISSTSSQDALYNLSENINKISSSMEDLQSNLTQEEVHDLKDNFEKLNVEILSLSTRTNKLLLNSDESYQSLSKGLDQFSSVIYQLEERINYLDNKEVNERIEKKIDNLNAIVTSNANSDKVFHQVLNYLGEWIDTTTEKITEINEKTSGIEDMKEVISDLKESLPDKSYLFDEIEEKFEEQQSRIDRLEMKLDKILSAIEEKDDSLINGKIDQLGTQLSKLGINIEKLASYVEE